MPPQRPRPFAPPTDAAALLQAVATPLLPFSADRQLCWANPAAQALWGQALEPGQDLLALWPEATAVCGPAPMSAVLPMPGALAPHLQAFGQPLVAGGWLLSLQPAASMGAPLDVNDRASLTQRADEMTRRFELVTRTAGIGWWVS